MNKIVKPNRKKRKSHFHDKYHTYEAHKSYLKNAGLTPEEYEVAIHRLAKKMGI